MKTFLLNSRKSNISACTTECFDLSAKFFTPDWAEISNNQSRNLFTFYVWVYLFAIIILNKYSSNSLEVIIADKDGNHRQDLSYGMTEISFCWDSPSTASWIFHLVNCIFWSVCKVLQGFWSWSKMWKQFWLINNYFLRD